MTISQNPIVLVTGASRGAGKGIALALAEQLGATVYITGRSQRSGDSPLPGTIFETAELVDKRDGKGIPVACDHRDDAQVKALFAQIERDHGHLDILVNNALCVPEGLTQEGPFWEKPLGLQELFNVGLRSSYVASYYAAPLLLKAGSGLIVNTSSAGGRCYMHGPAYGAGKAAVDKMAHDMAVDFKDHNIAVIPLWMGLLSTERSLQVFAAQPELYAEAAAMAESPEFPGRVIAALAKDPELMGRSGKVAYTAELAEEYGISDIGGEQRYSPRGMLGDPTEFNPAIIA
ncbi:SDR family NAD(P)-dependent oxidoreductase [Spongiibacter sp. KMU-158]|uniref:SDR family NAD(P)-dependent oxidoreductase n=1 Tax=Spongiibacter pelagi TaxID=2760804 RepID=A0A927C2H1_9GAMM|nr:SDR family NAD(P)-dependent oxidoreductase [Spongiibacter pelagi]MBD2859554.1 SDR family NAD(P)-dependent oxidoreductase [Spongiibacter pelagi]